MHLDSSDPTTSADTLAPSAAVVTPASANASASVDNAAAAVASAATAAVVEAKRPAARAATPRVTPQTAPRRSRRGASEYDLLLGRLLQQSGHHGPSPFIGFAGCHRRTGVSTIAANIAIRAADFQNGEVLLVDANTDFPRQRRQFGLADGPGLVEVLGESVPLEEAIVATRIAGLSLLGSRTRNRMAPLSLMEGAVEGFMKDIRDQFSVVIFDLPSDESLSNWRPLLQNLEAMILVISSEETTQSDVQKMRNQCLIDNVSITGTVVNRYRSYVPWFLRRR